MNVLLDDGSKFSVQMSRSTFEMRDPAFDNFRVSPSQIAQIFGGGSVLIWAGIWGHSGKRIARKS